VGSVIGSKWKRCPDTHCPCCGSKAVYVEDSDGDYYCGPTYVCIICEESGSMWAGNGKLNAQWHGHVVDILRYRWLNREES
jgi:hypothetical protein